MGMTQRELSAVLQLHRINQYGLDIVEQTQASNDDGIFDQYARVLFTANSDEEASLISTNCRQ